MLPSSFRARRSLELCNLVGVGASLASATSAIFMGLLHHDTGVGLASAFPTLLVGMLWVWLLRMPLTLGKSTVRVGWLLSIPLAALNAALAAGLLLGFEHGRASLEKFFLGLALGASFGAIFWVPALLLTLLAFGTPIAWSQKLAKKGLAGQERGEGIVGAVSAVIALVAGLSNLMHPSQELGHFVSQLLALVGTILGSAAVLMAYARSRARASFVAEVEAGKVEHFRVDTTDEGKVLVRVVSQGQGYRVADYEEEVAALDAAGAVTRAKA